MMVSALVDNLVIVCAVIYYLFLCFVFLLRAYKQDQLELRLAPVFSVLLVPFSALWIANLFFVSDSGRLISGFPIIVFFFYDLWYRLLSRKKPVHHPKKWPAGLILYLVLLQVGSIGLNWYGYIVSRLYGYVLVICYFGMLGCFGFYQMRHTKRK